MKKFFLSAFLLTAGLFSTVQAAEWEATDVNVAKGCQSWISAYWGGDKANMTDGVVDGTNCQLKVDAPQTVEWVVVDLGYEYDITKISLTTTGDRKDKKFTFFGAPAQATAPVFADGNDALADVWTKIYEAEDLYEDVNFQTTTQEVAVKARYIKYEGTERAHSDIYGTAICEIRVAGTTTDASATNPASVEVKGVPTISVGQTGNIVIAVLNNAGGALDIDPAKLSATSSNTAIATAAVDGTQIKVTGIKAGTANITINYDGLSVVQAITVNAALTAAPTPTVAADLVLSLYSNAYDAYDYGWYDWGGCILDPMTIDGDNLLHAKNFKYLGSQFKTGTDVSEYDYFHVDIYPTKDTTIGIVPITQQPEGGNSPERGVTVELTAFQWNSVEIPMQDFVDNGVINLDRLYQLKYNGKIVGADQWNADGTFDLYLDNVYFYKDANATATPTLTAEAQNITMNSAEIAYEVVLPAALTGATVQVLIDGAAASASPIALTGLTDNTEYSYTLQAVATLAGETYESKEVTVSFKTLRDASANYIYTGTLHLAFENAFLPGQEDNKHTIEADADYTITYTADGDLIAEIDITNLPEIVGLANFEACVVSQGYNYKGMTNNNGILTATWEGVYEYETPVERFFFKFPYAGGALEANVDGYTYVGKTNSEAPANPNDITLYNGPLAEAPANTYVDVDGVYTANVYNITDGYAYTNDKEIGVGTVNYARTYGHANWQGWHMPFDVDLENMKAYVAQNSEDNKYEVIEFSGVVTENGESYVEFTLVEDGDAILKANTPYLFMPKATGDVNYTFSNVTIQPAQAGAVGDGSYKLVGTYEDTKGFKTMNAYVLSSGKFCKTNSDDVTLKPFRAYLAPVTGNAIAEKLNIRVRGDQDGIHSLVNDVMQGGQMYDLNGRPVNNPTRGIYILNGQKIIIR